MFVLEDDKDNILGIWNGLDSTRPAREAGKKKPPAAAKITHPMVKSST
jgi:hypothetical protein